MASELLDDEVVVVILSASSKYRNRDVSLYRQNNTEGGAEELL